MPHYAVCYTTYRRWSRLGEMGSIMDQRFWSRNPFDQSFSLTLADRGIPEPGPPTKRLKVEGAPTPGESKMAASGMIDPTKRAKYPVVLSDALLGKPSRETYTGVRCKQAQACFLSLSLFHG